MDVQKVIAELKRRHPHKKIIKNNEDSPTEILCEVEPSTNHLEYSLAVAVVDESLPHVHKKGKETYKVTKGKLFLFINDKRHELKEGEELVIKPRQVHWAKGDETWIECYSKPGWTFEDHILTDRSKFAVSTYDKIADKYTQRYFDDLSDSSYIDKFLSYLSKGAKILDIGCGPGTFTNYAKKKGFDIEGIDLSEEMIKISKQKNPQGTFRVKDMRRLGYNEASFDGLLTAYSLIHIPSEEILNTLKGFNRVLKPNGTLMVIAQKGEPDRIVNEPLKEGEKIFINFFSLERLTKFVTDAGFKVEYKKEAKLEDSESLSDRVIYLIARKQ